MCSGRVDPQFVLDALAKGADAVLIGGCHPFDCHYVEGNYKCLRRFQLLKRMVQELGIEGDRLRLEWISAAEGDKVRTVINEMSATIRRLGPLGIPAKVEEWDREMEQFAAGIEVLESQAEPCESHAGVREGANV
jgi:F420-non-reducing hydrogenase iron-sulfur subunit